MPSASFSHTSWAPARPDRVFEALQDSSTWESIGGVGRVDDARHDASGRLLGYRFTAEVAGMRYPGEAVVTRSDAPDTMVVEIDTSEVGATVEVGLMPDGRGTSVTVALEVSSKGFVSAMAFPMISSAIGSGLPANVDAFTAGLD